VDLKIALGAIDGGVTSAIAKLPVFGESSAHCLLHMSWALIRARCLRWEYVESRVSDGSLDPFFASVSACSLPMTPQWPGDHLAFIRSDACWVNISLTFLQKRREHRWPGWVEGSKTDDRAEDESEKRKTSPMCGLPRTKAAAFELACASANISASYTVALGPSPIEIENTFFPM